MPLYSLFVVLLFYCNALGSAVDRRVIRQTGGDPCTTATNELGTCIPIRDCPYLFEVQENSTLSNDPKTDGFLIDSFCGWGKNNDKKVCCSLDPKNPPQLPSIATTTCHSKFNQTQKFYSRCRIFRRRTPIGPIVPLGEFPWIVAIGYLRPANPTIMWQCSGILISNKWVVTAAHCADGIGNLTPTTVRMGDLNLNDTVQDNANPVETGIDTIIPHPQYQADPRANDIALLRLKDTVTFQYNIRPICVPHATNEFKSDCFYLDKYPQTAGWRRVFQQNFTETTGSDQLRRAQVKIEELNVCDEKYKSGQLKASIDNRVLCASSTKSYHVDSGGPLIMEMQGKLGLAGIKSAGCTNETFPVVYTKVAVFADWIRSTTELVL